MAEDIYADLIRSMTWSFSRVTSFASCKYAWFLKYLLHPDRVWPEMFFSSFGSKMHELLADYYRGSATPDQMAASLIGWFPGSARLSAPSQKVRYKYFSDGLSYFSTLPPVPTHKVVAVEEKFETELHGVKLVGFIDLLYEQDGELVLCDHKSRALKPRSTRGKYTKSDEELDAYLRQLYLYSHFVKERYGKYPDKLCFNCFRSQDMIFEPFRMEQYEITVSWLLSEVEAIIHEWEFKPHCEWFHCKYLCEMHDSCDFYKIMTS